MHADTKSKYIDTRTHDPKPQIPEDQMYKHKDTETQAHKDSKARTYTDTNAQIHKRCIDITTERLKDIKLLN